MDSFKKCELESDISRVVADFRKSVTGKGPDSVNVFIKGDMIILREKGVFTTQEEELVKTEKGRQIVKQLQVI
ncbi:MAG: Na-translocating system protein MpsC family protein, partial [Candidatus Saccharibacteria bacterium]